MEPLGSILEPLKEGLLPGSKAEESLTPLVCIAAAFPDQESAVTCKRVFALRSHSPSEKIRSYDSLCNAQFLPILLWGEMEQVIGKCANLDCSQYDREKSILVCVMYGYGQPDMSVACPECGDLLIMDRKIRASTRLRHALRSVVPALMSKAFEKS